MTRYHHRNDDPPGIVYPSHNGALVRWLLGIAATVAAASILFCAKALYDINARLAVIDWRLARLEASVGVSRPASYETIAQEQHP